MTNRLGVRALRAVLAVLVAAAVACASSTPVANANAARPCAGLTPPRVVAPAVVTLPATYAVARVSAEMPVEVTVLPDGAVGEVSVRTTDMALLAPYAEESAQRSRFSPAAIEGNPVSVRVPVRVALGAPSNRRDLAFPALWAFVPGGASREALWQLRGSVSRLTLVVELGRGGGPLATVVAISPGGAERTLLTIPGPSSGAAEIRETVATGKFFHPAGAYRLELRTSNKTIATAHLTIADDFQRSVVNACEPLPISRKTGPGN